jgi:ABC-type bacteriocin/lantibiotic exporter with double-glycine peptidase domain
MLTIKDVALQFGVCAQGWKLDLLGLAKSRFPLILFIEERHFVVADSVDQNGYVFLRDPAVGRMKMRTLTLVKIWKGETMTFGEDTTRMGGTME